jgi:hypothetical protein
LYLFHHMFGRGEHPVSRYILASLCTFKNEYFPSHAAAILSWMHSLYSFSKKRISFFPPHLPVLCQFEQIFPASGGMLFVSCSFFLRKQIRLPAIQRFSVVCGGAGRRPERAGPLRPGALPGGTIVPPFVLEEQLTTLFSHLFFSYPIFVPHSFFPRDKTSLSSDCSPFSVLYSLRSQILNLSFRRCTIGLSPDDHLP